MNSATVLRNCPQFDLHSHDNSHGFRPRNEINHDLLPRQIATRPVLPRDLPQFTGLPEEWPIFISNLEESTRMCGYTNSENLIRLQRSLRGKALDTVRCLLLLPDAVPSVIETLRMRFGNPELIINNILHRIRSEPHIKAERLDMIIEFSIQVQNMCATMEAARMRRHLSNPTILQEFTEKLPVQQRLQWGAVLQTNPDADLSVFSIWLQSIARAASTVTSFSTPFNCEAKTNKGGSKGVFTHTNSAAVIEVEQFPKPESQQTHKRAASQHKSTCHACNNGHHKLESCRLFKEMSRNQRWNLIKEKSLCFICLDAHSSSRCSVKTVCGISECPRKHHRMLHNDTRSPQTNIATCNAHQIPSKSMLYRIIPVTLYGTNAIINTFAFIDEGSSVTLIQKDIAETLSLRGTPKELCLQWTSEVSRVEEDSQVVNLHISGQNDTKKHKLQNVRTVKNLQLPTQSIDFAEVAHCFPHLKGLPVKNYTNAVPTIMIGLDNYKVGIPLKVREGAEDEPTATKTRLGWIIHGPISNESSNRNHQAHHITRPCQCQSFDNTIQDVIKDYLLLDNLGVNHSGTILESAEVQRARHILESTTVRDERGFTTGLLWRFDDVQLPDSLPMARNRLQCLEKKMTRDPELAQKMQDKMHSYIDLGYVRKLTRCEIQTVTPRTWYLPIFAITNPNKPDKFRMVWDAAATVGNVSLNSTLLKGPDLLCQLNGVLSRFRERRVAICGDIRQMFHQVRIHKEDQDSQRFLWRTCSAQFVMHLNATEHAEEFPEAAAAIKSNHYVDDWLDSSDSVEGAIQLAKDVIYVHQRGGFEIRNWQSNSKELLNALGCPTPNLETKSLQLGEDSTTSKVLGLWWCTMTDTFKFTLTNNKSSTAILNGTQRPTKRDVLRTVMSIYDPLGYLTHLLTYVKVLLQEIWRSKIHWDDEIQDTEFEKWLKWIQMLPNVSQVKIPRCIRQSNDEIINIQLHTFVDASATTYAAVSYLRITTRYGPECTLLISKSRVAPQKLMSIPRLELQAAVLGTRIAASVSKMHTLNIAKRFFWTDSRNVLSWIQSDARKYRQFVAFRITEILETTLTSEWRWIPTLHNVADEATKWEKPLNMEPTSRWYSGPEFLVNSEHTWPRDVACTQITEEDQVQPCLSHNENEHHTLWRYERFSNWNRLMRAQAFVNRFIHNTKCSISAMEKQSGPLSQQELAHAEFTIYRLVQREVYPKEVQHLRTNPNINHMNSTSKLLNRSPYMDENGILRMRGRIDAALTAPFDMKRPILLPKNHPVTLLIANSYHRKFHHHNHQTAINEIRQKFSVPSVRATMNTVRSKCQTCRNLRSKPRIPEMGELPIERLTAFERPFTSTGIDFFGPITVTVGRRHEKRWGAIFTCLTVRAVHIELAYSLSTDSFIMCLRNFIARRGSPRTIYCDNGTNFRGAETELCAELKKIDFSQILEKTTSATTEWKFNPPLAPHMGGSWERLIRSIKTSLYAILQTRNPSEELLRSLLLEVESILNSRPLTHVPIECTEDEALTPNHFLLGSSSGFPSYGEIFDNGPTRRQWKTAQQLADKYWSRWIGEYLPTLTRRTKWFAPAKPIQVGDIVLIVDSSSPRNSWPKALVQSVTVGTGGQVRKVTVQTSRGIFVRPASKLAVLDVRKSNL